LKRLLLLLPILAVSTIFAESLDNAEAFDNDACSSICRYWVQFSDRGQWEYLDSDEIYEKAIFNGLTQASIDRRVVEGLEGDSLITLADLPPDPEYIDAVSNAGAEIRRISRWFNRISIEADLNIVNDIKLLPFVSEVTAVGRGYPASWAYEEAGRWEGYPAPGEGADLPGMYGPSYMQNLQVNAIEAHRQGYTGRGVLMLILDSGFELSHEAYSSLDKFTEYDFVEDDDYTGLEIDVDSKGQPNHGTGCLSVIAGYRPGNLIGIAYEASFILAKTEDVRQEVVQEEDDFIAAMEWGERLGARVLGASLSYKDWYDVTDYDGETPLTSRAANHARKLGVLSVTSMGNEGPQPMTLGAPAEAFGVIGAGAVDSTGKVARFSSRGPSADGRTKPDLTAMGIRTACVSPQTEHYYSRWNGTSLSQPVLSAVCALVRGAHPDWSTGKVERALKETASHADRPDNIYGWGIPDVMAAINWTEDNASKTVVDKTGEINNSEHK